MAIRLLIFDLDGTLVDSSRDISGALNHAVEPYGLGEVSLEETISLVGEGLTRLIGKLVERRSPGLDIEPLVDRFLSYYSSHLSDKTVPYPGTERVLKTLAPYKKAVVSNKIESLSAGVLQSLHLMQYFDYVAGGDTLAEKKPSPVPILDVLARFGMMRDEALLVGDSIYDMDAGLAAGVRTVAAMYGYGSPGFADRADFRIDSIEDLLDVVRQA